MKQPTFFIFNQCMIEEIQDFSLKSIFSPNYEFKKIKDNAAPSTADFTIITHLDQVILPGLNADSQYKKYNEAHCGDAK